MISFNANSPKPEIIRTLLEHYKKQDWAKDLPEEKLTEIILKSNPWLECPAEGKEKVPPMRCMFCFTGHMTECHYPHSCSEAECSHYQRDEDLWMGDPESS